MRTSIPAVIVTATALLLTGCGGAGSSEGSVTTSPVATSSAPGEETLTPEPSATPSETEEPAAEPSGEPVEPSTPATELPASVLLPAASLAPAEGSRTESEGVVDWVLPDACSVGAPTTAVAMRSVVQGDGMYEVPVGHHQVASFADADAAVAEAARIGETLTGCTGAAPDDGTRTVAEPLEVGAQGRGLVVDYDGSFAMHGDEDAMGYYTAVTRRGNVVTLVASVGGESTVAASRETVVAELRTAWDQLCAYDAEGC